MTVFQKIAKAVKMYDGTNAAKVVTYCNRHDFTKLQMSSVARQTGINRDLFWVAPKTEELPDNYWSEIEDAVSDPEKYGIYA